MIIVMACVNDELLTDVFCKSVLSVLCIFLPVHLERGELVNLPSDVAAFDRVTVSRGLAEPVKGHSSHTSSLLWSFCVLCAC